MVSISEALASTATVKGDRRCVVGRFLDGYAGQDGHDDLASTFEEADKRGTHYRRLSDLTHLTMLLDNPISMRSCQLHRARSCACYGHVA